MATFTPPQRGNRGWPDVAPFKYLSVASSPPWSANVFKLLDGTYTEKQPVTATVGGGWELLDKTVGDQGVYYGGHTYTVSAAEAAALTAAGYGANIT